jgi:hypothetical protein
MDVKKLIEEKGCKGAFTCLIGQIEETERRRSELCGLIKDLDREKSDMHKRVDDIFEHIRKTDPERYQSMHVAGQNRYRFRFMYSSLLFTVERNLCYAPESPNRIRIVAEELSE